MKRLFALLLVVAMLLSLCVLPTSAADSAADKAKLSVDSFYKFTSQDTTNDGIAIGDRIETCGENDYLAVRVTFCAEDKDYYLMGLTMSLKYDSSMVEPYYWENRMGATFGYAYFANNFMSGAGNEKESGRIELSGASNYGQDIRKGTTVNVAYFLFKVKPGVEAGNAAFELECSKLYDQQDPAGDAIQIQDTIDVVGGSIPVNGVAPTIGSIAIDPEKASSTYASGETFTLSAASTKGTRITNRVEFKVQQNGVDYTGNGLTIEDDKLTVATGENAADVGTYTITATPKPGVDCNAGTPTAATFTITPATIEGLTVTITGFGKGQDSTQTTATADNAGLATPTITWSQFNSEDTTPVTTFVGGTSYKASILLSAKDKNYKFKDGFSVSDVEVTADGRAENTTIGYELTKNSDGTYTLLVTLKTAAKDTPQITLPATPITAIYGQTLADIEEQLSTALSADVPGTFTWKDSTTDVGNVGEEKTFTATFMPNDQANYTNVDVEVPVNVEQKEIDLSSITNASWKYPAGGFTYDGTVKTVELNIPADLQPYVEASYVGNTATNVPGAAESYQYTATATLSLKDSVNCKLKEGADTRRTLEWTINKADYTGEKSDCTKHAYVSASQRLTLTPADFGMSTADAIYNEITGVSFRYDKTDLEGKLVTNYETVDAAKSLKLDLRAATADEVTRNYTETYSVVFTSPNYNDITVTLKIVASNKETKTGVITITNVSDTYTYGSVVSPDVEGKPEDAGNETFTYYDEQNNVVNVATGTTLPVGKYTVVASCEDNTYIYTASKNFEINPRSISGSTVTFTPSSLVYDNDNHELTMSVTLGGKELTPTTDYTVTFDDAAGVTVVEENQKWGTVCAPGEYKFTVKGKGNYAGEVTATFTVGKASLKNADVGDIAPVDYDGTAKTPKPTVTFNGITLKEDTDYTLSYSNNTNVGNATITITAKADSEYFTDSTEKTFKINAIHIDTNTKIKVAAIPDQVYNAQPQEPAVTVKFGDKTLVKGTDYTVNYANNTNVSGGTLASATITGIGNFTGEKQATFKINPANLNLSNKNFTHVYTDNVNQTYTVPADMFLAAEKEANKEFTITKTSLTYALTAGEDVLTGNPTVSGNTISYTLKGTPDALGTVAVEVPVHATCGNYKDSTFLLTITVTDKTDVSNNISFPDGTRTYTGSGIKYEAATLNGNSVNMTYTYAANVNTGASLTTDNLPLTVGTYTVTATYSDATSFGSKTATFEIKPATPTTPDPVKVDGPGKKLADLEESMRKDIGLAGQFTWTDANGNSLPSTTEIQPDTEYKWTFTPDNANYSEIKGSFVPYVDDISYLPAVIGGNTGSFNFRDVTRTDYYYNAVKWAAENGIASGTSSRTFSPDAVCTRAQTVTFLWRAAGSPLPRYRVNPFTDVSPYDYYYNAVLWAVEEGITTGLTATTFGPDATVTRGQVATFLYRAASAAKPNTFNPFTDVKSSAYHYDAILWAYDNSITTGTSTTTFSPDAFCTRAQIVTFLYRFYQGR